MSGAIGGRAGACRMSDPRSLLDRMSPPDRRDGDGLRNRLDEIQRLSRRSRLLLEVLLRRMIRTSHASDS